MRITSEQRALLNSKLSLLKMLKKLGAEVRANGTLCCPFHDDERPSAKLFPDNRMWCFTCGKMYFPVDFIYRFQDEFNLVKIILRLESQERERQEVGEGVSQEGREKTRKEEQYNFSELEAYRRAEIDILSFENRLFNIFGDF